MRMPMLTPRRCGSRLRQAIIALKKAEDVQLSRMRFSTFRNQLFESGRIAEKELKKKIHKKHRGLEWKNKLHAKSQRSNDKSFS